jgi:putative SOS response-associated peptidase YedK
MRSAIHRRVCGRFVRTSPQSVIIDEFCVEHFVNVDLAPRYNIAPSQPVETIINDGTELRMGPMSWGYTMSSADKTKAAPINARAETVATMPLFREAFQRRRCLVVADGFYERQKNGNSKTPCNHSDRSDSQEFGQRLERQWVSELERALSSRARRTN